MKENHFEIMCLALSSEQTENRVERLKKIWPTIQDELVLFRISKTDEIASHIAWLLSHTDINYSSIWKKELVEVEFKVSILMDTLEILAAKLQSQNIQIVALKNAGITKGIYPVYGCSPMGDIDLLVSADDFHKAHQIITEELGFTFKFRSELEDENVEEAFKGGGTEYFKEVNGQIVWIELQWRPIAGRWIQPHNEPNGDALLQRSTQVRDSAVRILAPEDNLLQVALHTAKHSYVRAPGFRLHSDVDRIVRCQIIDWEAFVCQVVQLKLKTAVYFSLFFAKEMLKTPVPNHVLDKIKPTPIRRSVVLKFIKKAGLVNKDKRKFSKFGYIIFNLFLYDSILEITKAIFPPFAVMKEKYNLKSRLSLPYFHLVRLKSLLIKRATL